MGKEKFKKKKTGAVDDLFIFFNSESSRTKNSILQRSKSCDIVRLCNVDYA